MDERALTDVPSACSARAGLAVPWIIPAARVALVIASTTMKAPVFRFNMYGST
jgi:hypothetical protein